MMRTFMHLWMACLLPLFYVGCTPSVETVSSRLLEAERLTWTDADSALKIVRSIPMPEALTGKERADYALLLSHLQYRCYVPFTSDSLINIALEYYKESKDWNKRGTAWYMKGIIWEEVYDNIPEAIKAYLQAEKCIPQMTDPYLSGRIYRCLGLLNKKTQNFDLAKAYYQQALKKDLENKELRGQISDWINLSNTYFIIKKKDSARWALDQLQEASTLINDSAVLAKVYHNLAVGKMYLGDTSQMESLLLKALQLTPQQPSYKTLSNLAKLYLRQGKKEKADSLYQKVLAKADLPIQATVYAPLYREALKDKEYEKAARYAIKFIDIQEAFYEESRHKETLEIQKKYDYMEVQYQSALKEKRLYFVILLLVAAAVSAFCIFRLYIYRLQKRYAQLLSDIERLENHLVAAKKQGFTHQEEAKRLQVEIVEKNKEMDGLFNRIKLLSRLDVSQLSSENVKMMEVVLSLMENRTCDLKQDRMYIRKWLNLSKNHLVDRLLAYRPVLKEHYIDICCLMALGLSIDEVAQIMEVTPRTVERYMAYICIERKLSAKGKRGFLSFLNELTALKE